ncbi:MAG TPA: glycosyltransferase family 2 protein [Candidatus Saccharimonadales bacterium]|nr:glycosyltransferase family 2 protein [Candidatus Saccharimonadales bacterium]
MNPPLVSICIPTYNRPEYLRRAVESCLAQTYPHFEIVITDNSTNNDSAEMAARWKDPRVRYCKNEGNIGATASCNRVVALATGKYLKWLMDDDLLKPQCLDLMVRAMEANPTAGMAMAPMELIDENDQRIFPRFYVFRRMHYRYRYQVGDGLVERRRLLKDFLTRDYPCTVPTGIMFRTEAFRRAGWFDSAVDFAGDLDMCMRVSAEWDGYYIDEVLSSERIHPTRHTSTLHRTGMKISAFYDVAHKCLAHPSVQKLFRDDWKKTVRDSMYFCSCRALLNGLAGVRKRDPGLIWNTIKTILREDGYAINILRLPLFVIHQVWISIFPAKLPLPRE